MGKLKKPNKIFILPDKFSLTKEEMIKIFDKVICHWNREEFSHFENAAYTSVMELTKITIRLNPIKVLEKIWYSILMFVEEMQTLNTLKNEAAEDSFKQNLLDIEWKRIETGEAFVEN